MKGPFRDRSEALEAVTAGAEEEAGAEQLSSPDAAARTTGVSVVTGGIWHSTSRVLPQAYTLIISVAAARYLGPDDLGRQSFIAFVALSVQYLLAGGMHSSLLRYVGEMFGRRRPGRVADLARWALKIQLVAGLLGGASLAVAGLVGAEPEDAWLLAGLGTAIAIGQIVPYSVLLGGQRWRAASLVGVLTGLLAVPATIAVLAAGGGISGMFAVEAASIGLATLLTSLLARRMLAQVAERREPSPELRRATMRFAALSTIGVFTGLIVWRRSEFFFLAGYSTDSQLAFYSIAFAAVTGLVLLPEAMGTALSPAFATLYGAGAAERIRSGYWRAQRLMLMFSLPLTAGLLALGPELITLVYGDEYRETGSVFLILMVLFPLLPLRAVATALLLGLGRLRVRLIAEGAAACLTVGLNFLLVPRLDAYGAALANAGGQLAVVIPVVLYSARLLQPVRIDGRFLLSGTLASAACGGAAWAVLEALGGAEGLALGLIAGLLAFTVFGMALRILAADDGAWLADVASRRLGPWARPAVLRFSAGAAERGT